MIDYHLGCCLHTEESYYLLWCTLFGSIVLQQTPPSCIHLLQMLPSHHITSHGVEPCSSDLTIEDDFQTVPKRIWLGLRYLKETEWGIWLGLRYLKETEWAEFTSLARNPSFSGWA